LFRLEAEIKLMPKARTPPSVRTSVRYYLWTEEGTWRLPERLHRDLVAGRATLRSVANSRQRIVEAQIRRLGNQALMVKARGVYYSFDAHGHLDVGNAAEAMVGIIDRARESPARYNVVDLGPRLRDRQWKREHTWKPSRRIVRDVASDVTGAKRIRPWKP
jgi:hypothetical protein